MPASPGRAPPPTPPSSLGGALVSAALEGTAVPRPGPTGSTAAPVPSAPTGAGVSPPAPPAPPGDGATALGRAKWTCTRCGTENTYAEDTCQACGASLFSPLAKRGPEIKDVPQSTVMMASIVPGGGFFALGLAGGGIARLVMTAWALSIGIVLGTSGTLKFLKILFLVAAIGLWIISTLDALSMQRGDRNAVILQNRVIVIVMAVLLGILFLGLVGSTKTPGSTNQEGPSVIEGPGAPTFDTGG